MWSTRLKVVAVALALSTGCIPLSLNPLYRDKDVVFEQWLVGVWRGEESRYVFERGEEGAYRLTMSEVDGSKDAVMRFKAHLLRLGKYTFLDLASSETMDDFEEATDSMESWGFLQVPAHVFVRLKRTDDTLGLAILNQDWLKEALAHKKVRLDYTLEDDRLLLTAPTSKLQSFVKKCAGNDDAFEEFDKLQRAATKVE